MTQEPFSLDLFVSTLATFASRLLVALFLLFAGRYLSIRLPDFLGKVLKRNQVDLTVVSFLENFLGLSLLAVTLLLVLAELGVQTASLIALLGAAGLAIGLALQGTLSNIASGVMLLVFRPLRVNDLVEAAGQTGRVRAITLFTTELVTPDNLLLVLPNSSVWGAAIKNYTVFEFRRVDLLIEIAYEQGLEEALSCLEEVVQKEPRVLQEPKSVVEVSELAGSSVKLLVRFWCHRDDYWPSKFALARSIKERFDHSGIEFSQQVVNCRMI